jgi:hypothetical protein
MYGASRMKLAVDDPKRTINHVPTMEMTTDVSSGLRLSAHRFFLLLVAAVEPLRHVLR